MKFFELQIEFMEPLWRRVLLVFVCLAWAMVEFLNGAAVWGVVFGSLGVYAFWQLFLDGWPASDTIDSTISEGNSDDSAFSHRESD